MRLNDRPFAHAYAVAGVAAPVGPRQIPAQMWLSASHDIKKGTNRRPLDPQGGSTG